eukprot:m.249321 g.249321  ORF g.249321 m.249321 type:complete len:888 (+) comp16087_c0_seq1:63-2726(+)
MRPGGLAAVLAIYLATIGTPLVWAASAATIAPAPAAPACVPWAVLTASALPSPDMLVMVANETEWTFLVLGEPDSPPWPVLPRVIFLSQQDLAISAAYRALASPGAALSREQLRNIGYLHAIMSGACTVYDTDAGLRHGSLAALLRPGREYLQVSQSINPMAYFGHPSVWPRGMRLTHVTHEWTALDHFTPGATPTEPLIRQALIDGYPDVDSTFQLTRVVVGHPLDVTFEPSTPIAIVGDRSYVPLNALSTLFTRDALWALVLPTDLSARIADTLRGYWAQRVMREIAGRSQDPTVSYHSPVARRPAPPQLDSSDAIRAAQQQKMATFVEEVMLQAKLDSLITFLREWQRPAEAATIPAVAVALARAMQSEAFWTAAQVAAIERFMAALEQTGYYFPPLEPRSSVPPSLTPNSRFRIRVLLPAPRPDTALTAQLNSPAERAMMRWDIMYLTTQVDMLYSAAIQRSENGTGVLGVDNRALATFPRASTEMCWQRAGLGVSTDGSIMADRPADPSPRVLIVVNYHWRMHARIHINRKLLHDIYRFYYNTPFDVVFVAPGRGKNNILGNGLGDNGFYSYMSLNTAYKRYPDYDGYFLVNDDGILNQPPLPASASHWQWQTAFHVANGDFTRVCGTNDKPWFYSNDQQCKDTLDILEAFCKGKYLRECGGFSTGAGKVFQRTTLAGQADFFYVPRRLMSQYVELAKLMYEKRIFLETAVPTIINTINDQPCFKLSHDATGSSYKRSDRTRHLCTKWGHNSRRFLHRTIFNETNFGSLAKSSCVAVHPLKFAGRPLSPEIMMMARAYLVHASNTLCKRPQGCRVQYSLNKDRYLWQARPVVSPTAPTPQPTDTAGPAEPVDVEDAQQAGSVEDLAEGLTPAPSGEEEEEEY